MLLSYNGEKTFLPNLHTITWIEDVSVEGLLIALAPQSLERMRLSVPWETSTSHSQVAHLFSRLAVIAPEIRQMSIKWTARVSQVEPLLSYVCLRRLALECSVPPSPKDLRTLFSILQLESLRISVRGIMPLEVEEGYESPSLRALHCTGSCSDVTWVLSHLNAPFLRDLSLWTDETQAAYHFEHHQSLLALVATATFVESLRALKYKSRLLGPYRTDEDCVPSDEEIVHMQIPARPLSELLKPLFPAAQSGRLALEKLDIEYYWPIDITDGDIERLAYAFGNTLKSLRLNPKRPFVCHPHTPKSPTHMRALRSLAEHCPHLERLQFDPQYDFVRMRDYLRNGYPSEEIAAERAAGARSCLRMLLLDMMADEKGKHPIVLAQFLHRLFPRLDVEASDREFTKSHEPGQSYWEDQDEDWSDLEAPISGARSDWRRLEQIWRRTLRNVRRLQLGEDIEKTWEEERRRNQRSYDSLEVELAEPLLQL